MTLLYHREVINIEKSQSYMDAKGLYTQQLMNGQSADLRLLHVVAAEQNAVLYEALIGTGELLPPRVRMLLADQEKFKLAASCWLYGGGSEMLHMHQYGSGAGKMSMWVLTVPPGIGEEDDRGLPREPEHFGLTTPKPGVPDILDAFETLVLSGEVQWYWEGDPDGQPRDYSTNPRPIPYGRILGTENSRSSFNRIEAKISQDIDDRKQREELGKKASMLTGPLSRLKEQDLAN